MTSTSSSSATPIDPRTGWVLLHKGEQEIYVWAVHASGWQSLGWSLGPALTPAPEPEEPDSGADVALPDFGAMTKAEIIEHCSRNHGVLLDSSLTKSALISEAEALPGAASELYAFPA